MESVLVTQNRQYYCTVGGRDSTYWMPCAHVNSLTYTRSHRCTQHLMWYTFKQKHRSGTPETILRNNKNNISSELRESPIISITNGMWHRRNEEFTAHGSSANHVMSPGGGTVGGLWQPHLEPSPLGRMLTCHCFLLSSFLKCHLCAAWICSWCWRSQFHSLICFSTEASSMSEYNNRKWGALTCCWVTKLNNELNELKV